MHIEITGRHLDVTPALREFTADKIRKIEKLLDGPLEVHVVLGIEKHRHTAEVQVKHRNGVLSANRETGDLYASISEVADRVERQALKLKEKLHDHKHRQSPRDPDIARVIEASVAASEADPQAPSEPEPSIVRRRRHYSIKPRTLEDAVMELEGSGEDLLVYRDADTEQLHIVHRQADGNFTLIEPEI